MTPTSAYREVKKTAQIIDRLIELELPRAWNQLSGALYDDGARDDEEKQSLQTMKSISTDNAHWEGERYKNNVDNNS